MSRIRKIEKFIYLAVFTCSFVMNVQVYNDFFLAFLLSAQTTFASILYLSYGLNMIIDTWYEVEKIGKIGLIIYICKMILFLLVIISLVTTQDFRVLRGLLVLPFLMQATHTLLVLDLRDRMYSYQKIIFACTTSVFVLYLVSIFQKSPSESPLVIISGIVLFLASVYYISWLPDSLHFTKQQQKAIAMKKLSDLIFTKLSEVAKTNQEEDKLPDSRDDRQEEEN